MKKYITLLVLLLIFTQASLAQQGNTLETAFDLGVLEGYFNRSEEHNTAFFTDNFTGREINTTGRPATNDVFYKFTINESMDILIDHCNSDLGSTYLYLLDSDGSIAYWNGSGIDQETGDVLPFICGDKAMIYIKKLSAGTYYIVSEGYERNGKITTSISRYTYGDTFENPIVAGSFTKDFRYSNTVNTNSFSNRNSARANDVYYQFSINRPMNVTISHCGSDLLGTQITLMNENGNLIAWSSSSKETECGNPYQAFFQRELNSGTYYIISEGISQNGSITTAISGYIKEDFSYPDAPSAYSSDAEAVGSIDGVFDVSAMGGATFSIPIEMPQGLGNLQPSLAVSYNSQSGNGLVGWGCNISGISAITRGPKTIYHDGTAKGITHLDDDALYLEGQRLILVSGTAGQNHAQYSPESDPFTKATIYRTNNQSWIEVNASNGIKYHYGDGNNARIIYTIGGNPQINAWYLNYIEDQLGNYVSYSYSQSDNSIYPSTIIYGGNNDVDDIGVSNMVTFAYESRNDIIPFGIKGVKGSISKRLKSITTKTNNSIYRIYNFTYNDAGDASPTKFSRLTDITVKNGAGEAMKPTKLNWSYLPAFSQSYATPSVAIAGHVDEADFTKQMNIAADINGDGLTDLISIFPFTVAGSSTNYIRFRPASIDTDGNISFASGMFYDIGTSIVHNKNWIDILAGFSFIDIEGNGSNRALVPKLIHMAGQKWAEFHFYNSYEHDKKIIPYGLKNSSEMPLYAIGDINNDGKSNLLIIERGHSSNLYPGRIAGMNDGNPESIIDLNFALPSKPERLSISDFNGDGLNDILVFYDGGYSIFWNQGDGISTTTISNNHKTAETNIGNVWMIREGDFNGDGLPDFIMNATGEKNWYFALNNGDGTFTKTLACQLDIYDQNFTEKDDDKFNCYVYDFDQDGRSDVVITKAMYTKKSDIFGSWGEFNKTYTYWMRSNVTSSGVTLTKVSNSTSNQNSDAKQSHFVLGDFNGDGQLELMNYGYNCYSGAYDKPTPSWKLYKNNNYNVNGGKVTSITNGYGATTAISYASLVGSGIYKRDPESKEDLDDPDDLDDSEELDELKSSYPMINYALPIHAVKSVKTGDGMNLNYKYKGLKVHLQGRGLLGMRSHTVTNTTLDTKIRSKIKFNTVYYQPDYTRVETMTGELTAISSTTLNFANKGGKKYFAYPFLKYTIDFDGNSITNRYVYNETYGYITEEKVVHNSNDNMLKKTEYGNHILAGGVYKPQLITLTQKHSDDSGVFTQKKHITYDTSKGYSTQIIENYESSLPLTTNYTYDDAGNISTTKISGSGVEELIHHTKYDDTQRFVKKNYTVPESETRTYTYDLWGNMLTEKDETNTSNVLTTTHTYDNWGNLKSTVHPDGRKTSYYSGWNNNSSKKYFTLTQAKGQPWVKTWYDRQGREVLVETKGPLGMDIKTRKAYNSKGQLESEESIEGNITTSQSYEYDERGRIKKTNNSLGKEVTYTYGNLSETTTTNGRSYTKTYDLWGNIKTSSDPVSSVSYKYKSVGKPWEITSAGATFSMTYHDTGLQKTLTDPNAGTTTYTYDAAGRMIKQVDVRGNTTIDVYDVLGRISTSTLNGKVTTYTYGTSGWNKGRLTTIREGNYFKYYYYDKYGRVNTEDYMIDELYSYYYIYNSLGQLSEIVYPGTPSVSRQYDAYGYLKRVTTDLRDIWELYKETGTVTTAYCGDEIMITNTRNSNGLLTSQKSVIYPSSIIHNIEYNFDPRTGNLKSRTGMIPQSETFGYDNLDRLTTIQHNGSTVMNIDYKPNGNISTKTGLGEYSYMPTKPHAVQSVENTDEIIPYTNQYIDYNDFNKPYFIIQAIEGNASSQYELNIEYGPDKQRWRSWLNENYSELRDIIYAGNFEQITENGTTYQLNYIYGGDGLAAIYVTQWNKSDEIYYVHKDHLGNIIKLTDEVGQEIFRASYDAWGKQTITKKAPFSFYRGYTGHEHIPELGLINMNGRMYDPVLGRFLSPDPYVQAPDFSQNFNRYSYCFNNPLIYTDPSGEIAWVPFAIGAVIGSYMGGTVANDGNFNPAKWDWNSGKTWGYMLGGGTIGGTSAAAGAAIASSGLPMANTLGMVTSSFSSSFGMNLMTDGMVPLSVNFGIGSYDFSNNDWGYLGEKGNSGLQNFGYGLGSLANVSDLLMGMKPQNVDLVTERTGEGHSSLVKHKTQTATKKRDPVTGILRMDDPNRIISVGPNRLTDPGGNWHWMKGTNKWDTYSRVGEKVWRHTLKVNKTKIDRYANWLNNMEKTGTLKYSLGLSSCVTHTSLALNYSGILNIGIHPHLLSAQMYLWSNGIRPWSYSYLLTK